ncbi:MULTISPECIES: FtsB family cell division protein [Caloramator]|uniref:Cell division protein FtsL n=2 Tax=Caloramator TaxID=44258 RepID=I7J511_9CLOT|nr:MULTISPECIES: cell division protein FtsL [Caloramator]MDO6354413.1 cell division protein FtsL [Caloramator sp. CAR-1]CCJ33356.1 hypothetical protein CAAU_1272 [Caloramator australicus RC3]
MIMASNKAYMRGSVAYKLEEKKTIEAQQERSKKVEKKSKKNFAKFVITVVFISFISFALLVRFFYILKLNAEIRSIKKEIKLMQDENDNLRVEIAKLNNIKDIDRIAVQKYGMIVPHPSDVHYLEVTPLNIADKEDEKTNNKMAFIYRLLGLIN